MIIYLAGMNGWGHICMNDFIGGNMDLYMAGGISGNLNPAWRRMSKGGVISDTGFIDALKNEKFLEKDKNMDLYIAGIQGKRKGFVVKDASVEYRPLILESFYYVDEDTERLLPYFGDFLLDSGAFTFMQNSKGHVEWDTYIKRYADFINKNNIEKFFELDIDSIVGYEKVLEYRQELEDLTGKRCIPVWHKSRGIKEFLRMCDEYDYVAIGGIVAKEISSDQYKAFPSMIMEAHKRGCKIHGLGFTNLEWLPRCHFDSVDSTAWTTGNRFGYIYKFNGRTMEKIKVPPGKRLSDPRKVALINFIEWLKFQNYAKTNL